MKTDVESLIDEPEQVQTRLRELCASWQLDNNQLCELVRLTEAEIESFPNKLFKFDLDQIERIGYLFSIDRILSDLFTEDQKRAWLTTRDTTTNFGDMTVLEKLLCARVRDLYEVNVWLRSKLELL